MDNRHLVVYDFDARYREPLTTLLGGRCNGALSRHLHPGEYLPYNFGT
jgi:hypothetical protein